MANARRSSREKARGDQGPNDPKGTAPCNSERLLVGLLGPFELRRDSGALLRLPKKAQALLAYLAMHQGRPIPRDQLATLLWGNSATEQARHSLRQCLASLRDALGAQASEPLVADTANVLLADSDTIELDVARFETSSQSASLEELEIANSLYRGDFLAGLQISVEPFSDWLTVERQRLSSTRSNGLQRLAEARANAGRMEDSIGSARQLTVLDPLREEGHRLLMQLLAAGGNRSAALKQHARCAQILRDELGIGPDTETNRVAEAIRNGEPIVRHEIAAPVVTPAITTESARKTGNRNEVPVSGVAGPKPQLALPDRPSIAVLAFINLNGDPSQEYFSDGITEDIITELSRFSELFVIARNSTFQYKSKSADVRQVGRELGVRYVLEGSIRRTDDRIRISARLIDAVTGAHRWAERYDRRLEDVFALQDELARSIVGVLAAYVNKAEAERTLSKPPATWQAYDYCMMATDILTSYHSSFDVEELYEGRRLLECSLAIDPNYARSYAALAGTHVSSWAHPFDDDFQSPASLGRAYASASRAVQLDPNLPQAHVGLGWVLVMKRQHEAAIAEFERAIALNPNFTNWRFAWTLVLAGEPARAIQVLETHKRLDPFYEPHAPGAWGFACYMLKRYTEALPHLRECVSRAPNMRVGHALLAATHAQLGQLEEARAEAAEVLLIDLSYTIDRTAKTTIPFKHPEDAEHLFDSLRKIGLPER